VTIEPVTRVLKGLTQVARTIKYASCGLSAFWTCLLSPALWSSLRPTRPAKFLRTSPIVYLLRQSGLTILQPRRPNWRICNASLVLSAYILCENGL